MDKELARKILPYINNPDTQVFLQLLFEIEKDLLLKSLTNLESEVQMRWTQGKLQQLERLKTIRDRIQEAAK